MSGIKNMFNNDKRMLLGGASKTADAIGIDVIFVRLILAFSFLFLEWEPTAVVYVLASAAFYFANRKEIPSLHRKEKAAKKRLKGSTHDLRTKLDTNDRRMMAIDHHLSSADSDRLAREIEELRTKVNAEKAAKKDPAPAADASPKTEGGQE